MKPWKAHLITIAIFAALILITIALFVWPVALGFVLLSIVAAIAYLTVYGMLTDQGPSDDYRGW